MRPMQTTIYAGKQALSVALHPAVVIHANKYSEAAGGWGQFPVNSRLYTDVVFQSKRSGRHWPIKIEARDLPIYNTQDVTVIAVEETIVGYIDTQNGEYYYTDTNFALLFNLGMRGFIALLLGIAVFLAACLLLPADVRALSLFGAAGVGLYYFGQRWIWNRRVEKALDEYLTD